MGDEAIVPCMPSELPVPSGHIYHSSHMPTERVLKSEPAMLQEILLSLGLI